MRPGTRSRECLARDRADRESASDRSRSPPAGRHACRAESAEVKDGAAQAEPAAAREFGVNADISFAESDAAETVAASRGQVAAGVIISILLTFYDDSK